jgi:hypothetical protein
MDQAASPGLTRGTCQSLASLGYKVAIPLLSDQIGSAIDLIVGQQHALIVRSPESWTGIGDGRLCDGACILRPRWTARPRVGTRRKQQALPSNGLALDPIDRSIRIVIHASETKKAAVTPPGRNPRGCAEKDKKPL